jgi:hypothetical protein
MWDRRARDDRRDRDDIRDRVDRGERVQNREGGARRHDRYPEEVIKK